MAQLLGKNLYYKERFFSPDIKKAVATLSTGQIAQLDGDSYGATQLYTGTGNQRFTLFLISADRLTRTQVLEWNYSDVLYTAGTYVPRASMVVDSANNLHVTYLYNATANNQQRLCYRKISYAAGVYTLGAEQVVAAYVANRYYGSIDIDIPAASVDCPLIVAAYRTGTTQANYVSAVTLYNRQTAGTWLNVNLFSGSANWNTSDVSLACKIDTTTTGSPTYVVATGPGNQPAGRADSGDFVYSGRYTIGGAFVGAPVVVFTGINGKFLNGGFRNYYAFSLTGDYYVVYGEIQTDPNIYWWTIIQVNTSTGAVTQMVQPRTGSHTTNKMTRPAYSLASVSLYRLGGGKFSIGSYTVGVDSPVRSDLFLTLNGAVWTYREPPASHLPNAGLFKSSTIQVVLSGDSSRFANANSPICIAYYTWTGTTYVYKNYIYTRSHMQQVQVINDPTENATKSTNKITASLGVSYAPVANDQTSPTYDARAQVQISTAINFQTNVYDATQDPSEEKTFAATVTGVDVNLGAYPLTQATWYMRARMVDSLGNVSAWSPTRTFRVSHPAVPTNARPGDQSAVPYISNSSIFAWDFADAYPDDSQRAYRFEALLSATQATLYDSGKVVSTAKQIQVDLGAANLDNTVDWFLTLWDQEDVAGPRTFIGTVLFTTNPTPIILNPATDAAVLTTAQPGISWDPGVGTAKTQYSYRILIRNFIDNTLVYDSGRQISTDVSYNVAPGYLHNNGSYTMDLMIEDSVGLGTTVKRTFTTSWIPPVPIAAPLVYPDRHNTHGFVAVSCNTSAADPDSIYFTLYRRSLDRVNASWTPIFVTEDLSGSFVYLDYLCPSGILTEYMVTQSANRFGDILESDLRTTQRTQYAPKDVTFWLVDPLEPKRSVLLPNVTTNSYTDEYEKSDYTIVGLGRQIEEGEHVGITGSLEVQVRPRSANLGGTDNYNLLTNTNLRLTDAATLLGGSINNAGALTGSPVITEVNAVPGPGNRGNTKIGITCSKGTAGTNNIQCGFSLPVPASPYMSYTLGKQYHLSAYVNCPTPVTGYEVRVRIQWTLAGTVVSSDLATLTNLSTGLGAMSAVMLGTDIWYRVGKTVAVPSGVDGATVQVLVASTGSTVLAPITVFAEGLQLTLGTAPIDFFNGDSKSSAVWTGVEEFDPSYTPGFVAPRLVKQNIEWLRQSGHDLFIRTPFGDVWEVYVNDLTVSNIAGTGTSEFVDISMPYMQVGNS
jgi:hypothetical protein